MTHYDRVRLRPAPTDWNAERAAIGRAVDREVRMKLAVLVVLTLTSTTLLLLSVAL